MRQKLGCFLNTMGLTVLKQIQRIKLHITHTILILKLLSENNTYLTMMVSRQFCNRTSKLCNFNLTLVFSLEAGKQNFPLTWFQSCESKTFHTQESNGIESCFFKNCWCQSFFQWSKSINEEIAF